METLVLNGFEIIPCGSKHATHKFSYGGIYKDFPSLDQEFCKQLCEEHDAGPRFSEDSRYHYTTPYTDKNQLGMYPVAAVQDAVTKFYGQGIKFIKISKKS